MKTLRETIIDHPFLLGLKPEHTELLVSCAREVTLKANQFIFHEGEPAERCFLIQSGRIAIEARQPGHETALVQTLGAGDVLGWSWLFPPFWWHFQARALEPTRAIVLDGGHLLAAADRNHEFGYELMKRVAQILIQRLQATRKQLVAQQAEPTRPR